jgi:hypothetical protein
MSKTTLVKRCLWLSAWSVWFACGVGLYRELPRGLGTQVSNVAAGSHESVFGFIGDQDFVAIFSSVRPEQSNLVLRNARDGGEVGSRECPLLIPYAMSGNLRMGNWTTLSEVTETLRFGILLGRGRLEENSPSARVSIERPGVYAFDVMKDERRQLTDRTSSHVILHPTKPWIAIVDFERGVDGVRVVVADYATGKRRFEDQLPADSSLISHPLFLPADDQLLLHVFKRLDPAGNSGRAELQIWNLGDPPSLEETLDLPRGRVIDQVSVSLTGRVMFPANPIGPEPDAEWMDVYDFRERKFLSTAAKTDRKKKGDSDADEESSLGGFAISPSGRFAVKYKTVYVRAPGARRATIRTYGGGLFEVGTGRTLWKASAAEYVEKADADSFEVNENWHELWKGRFPNFKYQTRSRRSLETGGVLYRMEGSIQFEPRNINASRTLLLLADGSVHPWPLQVDWKSLAICQAILASPLILLWSLLWWKRRREARRIPTAPLSPSRSA